MPADAGDPGLSQSGEREREREREREII